jgi:geranylgeranyl diphosphate synthase type I
MDRELENATRTFLPVIEEELQNIVNHSIPAEYEGLRAILAYHLGWEEDGENGEVHGKRIRPLIVLLSAASTGIDWRKAMPAAAAVELVHNFSLIHDDIQDQSKLRHGRPTVWVRWGVPLAINAGDLMFTLAQTSILRMSQTVDASVGLRSAEILNQTCIQLTGGQHLDLTYESQREVKKEAYWPMIEGKTAALIACCAELGGLAGQVDQVRLSAFSEFGRKLGLAFQVLDDWLGIWGNAALIGKSNESDLVSRKKSFPVLLGLERKDQFYHRWMEGSIEPGEARDLARLLSEEGAQQFTRETAVSLTDQSLKALSMAIVEPNEASRALTQLAKQLLAREL